jgi:hypothetical protein
MISERSNPRGLLKSTSSSAVFCLSLAARKRVCMRRLSRSVNSLSTIKPNRSSNGMEAML